MCINEQYFILTNCAWFFVVLILGIDNYKQKKQIKLLKEKINKNK
jgi:hypothetical protein